MLIRGKGILLFMFLVLFVIESVSANPTDNSALKDEIRTLLRDNPDIIMEILKENDVALLNMLQKAAVRQQNQEERQKVQAEIENPFNPEIGKDRPVRGNPDAPVTIVVYDDFQCPYCARGAKTLETLLKKHNGKIRVFLKHNPLEFHKQALPAALYFEAIAKQNHEKAWKFHDLAFEQQGSLKDGDAAFQKIAASLGVDAKKLASDIKNPEVKSIVENDMKEAQKFGFTGTPTFLINGISLRGAYPEEKFTEIIEFLLNKQK